MSRIRNRREVFGWAMFDFANSSFTTTIVTVYFSLYFKKSVAAGSSAAWGWTNGISLMIVVLAAPILGALSDFSGAKKRFLTVTWLGCVAGTAMLALVEPGDLLLGAGLFIIANACFSAGENFIAAFLPEIAAPENVGRVSGYGWSIGYFGGIGSVALCAAFSAGLGPVEANRVVCLVTAAFFLVAGVPTMLWLRERGIRRPKPPGESYLGIGFRRVAQTWRHVRRYRQLFRFLCVFLVFNCGVLTVVAFSVIFAEEALGFSKETEIPTLFIVINVAAAIGALGFGYLQDRIGSRRVIQATLVIWIVAVLGAAEAPSKSAFWVAGILVGVAIGSTQSASRALVGLFSPESRSGEFLGFWGSFGKLSGVIAIPLFGVISDAFDPRTAVRVCAIWFVLGFLGMFLIDEQEGRRAAREGLSDDQVLKEP